MLLVRNNVDCCTRDCVRAQMPVPFGEYHNERASEESVRVRTGLRHLIRYDVLQEWKHQVLGEEEAHERQ